MISKPEKFDNTKADVALQVNLAVLVDAIQQGGDVVPAEQEVVQYCRENHYPESYIQGALQHARDIAAR